MGFLPAGAGVCAPKLVCLYDGTKDLTLDTDATMTGHITITPLCSDLTSSSYELLTKKVG
ncbi:MAG: hypothetical protein HFK05_01230 [Clostridia bacterium]|nr:hypothetical protein [Clostridia bacterium]